MTRVVICDDHRVFADALTSVLEGRGYEVVECTDAAEAGAFAVAEHRPDLYLLDQGCGRVDLDEADGFDGIEAVRAASPNTRVVVVSGSSDPQATERARAAGAHGVVGKNRPLEDILTAIATVAGGASVFHELAAADRSNRTTGPARRAESRANRLTSREREILDRLVQGQATATLARELGVTYATARTHIQRLLAKLGVHSKLEAVAVVVAEGRQTGS